MTAADFVRDEVFRMVHDRDLCEVSEFTIAEDIAHLLCLDKDKDTLSQEEIDTIVSACVNEWLLEACHSDPLQDPTRRRLKPGNLGDMPIFHHGAHRAFMRGKNGRMCATSRRARPISSTQNDDDAESDSDSNCMWKKGALPVMKEYTGMSRMMLNSTRVQRRVALPAIPNPSRAKTTFWIQCDQCDKWRALHARTYAVCQAWDSFSCEKLENCDCDTTCDDAKPPETGRIIAESSIKWVCCDACTKWRPVDEKTFQLASSFKGTFECSLLGITCDVPELEEEGDSNSNNAEKRELEEEREIDDDKRELDDDDKPLADRLLQKRSRSESTDSTTQSSRKKNKDGAADGSDDESPKKLAKPSKSKNASKENENADETEAKKEENEEDEQKGLVKKAATKVKKDEDAPKKNGPSVHKAVKRSTPQKRAPKKPGEKSGGKKPKSSQAASRISKLVKKKTSRESAHSNKNEKKETKKLLNKRAMGKKKSEK